jgi:hypothetical protein
MSAPNPSVTPTAAMEALLERLRQLVVAWRREARVTEREWEMGGHESSAGAYTALDVCADALDAALKDEA